MWYFKKNKTLKIGHAIRFYTQIFILYFSDVWMTRNKHPLFRREEQVLHVEWFFGIVKKEFFAKELEYVFF